MDNEVANELATYRAERLLNFTKRQITESVVEAINMLNANAMHGLQGLDAADDGVTYALWEQAVTSSEMSGDLTFPGKFTIAPDDEPCVFEMARGHVSGRVARAILAVNGYTY